MMGGHLLHPELTADASGVARAHRLQEMLILMKLLGASCWKTRSSSIIAVLC